MFCCEVLSLLSFFVNVVFVKVLLDGGLFIVDFRCFFECLCFYKFEINFSGIFVNKG